MIREVRWVNFTCLWSLGRYDNADDRSRLGLFYTPLSAYIFNKARLDQYWTIQASHIPRKPSPFANFQSRSLRPCHVLMAMVADNGGKDAIDGVAILEVVFTQALTFEPPSRSNLSGLCRSPRYRPRLRDKGTDILIKLLFRSRLFPVSRPRAPAHLYLR